MSRASHVLIIVQNLPVPLDRRVWLECQALRDAGYEVSVICPKGPGDPARQVIDGVHIYKYRPPKEASGALGYAWEFVYCWLRTAWLSVCAWRRARFDAMQACNPPDTYWLLARLWRLRGVRFVFDHHDLNPEVFRSRFGEPTGFAGRAQLRMLYWLEHGTFRTADRVVSTNTSYQQIAVERGGVPVERTAVVRSGPDTSVMKPGEPKPELRRGKQHLVVYLGIMGPQDGVDGLLDVAERVVRKHGREDIQFALLGFGDCLADLKKRTSELGLDGFVHFTGRVGPSEIADYLSTASAGVTPDPSSPLNNVSTMNKPMEYMAYGLPSVSYLLAENALSTRDCAVNVEPGDVDAFTDALLDLLDDEPRRSRMGAAGRERAVAVLDWKPQARNYITVYDGLLRG